jgi:hypothetical protein
MGYLRSTFAMIPGVIAALAVLVKLPLVVIWSSHDERSLQPEKASAWIICTARTGVNSQLMERRITMAEETDNLKGVFKAAVTQRLNLHPNQWNGEDSVAVVRGVIGALRDDKGERVELTDEENDVIEIASRPTSEVQLRVIRTIVEKHNAKLDSQAEGLIKQVVSAAAFKTELAKAGIIKDEKASKLQSMLG